MQDVLVYIILAVPHYADWRVGDVAVGIDGDTSKIVEVLLVPGGHLVVAKDRATGKIRYWWAEPNPGYKRKHKVMARPLTDDEKKQRGLKGPDIKPPEERQPKRRY